MRNYTSVVVEIDERVVQVVRRRTGLPASEVHAGLRLADPALGLDSVALLELVLECERVCGCRLGAEVLQRGPLTVGELSLAIRGAVEPGAR